MSLPNTFEQLIETANQNTLYKKLVSQLNKDLARANIDLEFDLDVLPTSLKYLLQESVNDLIEKRYESYLNLLYVVDVHESKVQQLNTTDTFELSEAVTFLILQREWQKVWLKKNYS